MAYDPKSFLTRALKEGFQPQYAGPQSSEDTNLTYLGDLANIDGVQVRPMTIGGTEDAPEYGHVVSAPLSGKYDGYFRNDIFDDKGNFLRTTITEPGTSGLTDLAKFAVNAATFGGFGPVATTVARGIGALQSKNVPALLSLASGLPGVPSLPSEVSNVLKYAGQAKDLQKALEGDPGAIFKTIVGAAKMSGLEKGITGGLDLSGSDAVEGFFEPGGEGYDPAQEDIVNLLSRYPEGGSIIDDFYSSAGPYEANLEEILGSRSIRDAKYTTKIDPLKELVFNSGMTPEGFYLEELDTTPDWAKTAVLPTQTDTQQYEITAQRDPAVIPDWDVMPPFTDATQVIDITGKLPTKDDKVVDDVIRTDPRMVELR
jgi:hypothetical protein